MTEHEYQSARDKVVEAARKWFRSRGSVNWELDALCDAVRELERLEKSE